MVFSDTHQYEPCKKAEFYVPLTKLTQFTNLQPLCHSGGRHYYVYIQQKEDIRWRKLVQNDDELHTNIFSGMHVFFCSRVYIFLARKYCIFSFEKDEQFIWKNKTCSGKIFDEFREKKRARKKRKITLEKGF